MRRLVLAGGGHAHLEVLRRLALRPHPPAGLTLVSLDRRHLYSGMVPGYLQGQYREEEITFELPALAARAGGRFVQGRVTAVDPGAREISLAGGGTLPYDLISFNVGSRTAGDDLPGVRDHAVLVKPISRAGDLRRRLLELAAAGDEPCRATVVGGGAAGVEIACAIAAVLDRAGRERHDRSGRRVAILDSSAEILSEYSERFRRRALKVLSGKQIEIRAGMRVEGDRLPPGLTVWLTGAAAWPLFQSSGLPVDDRGFLLVDDALRSVADPRVLGAGDCVTLARHPDTPKAGVYAVREGPVLWKSLLAALSGTRPPRYEPQEGYLSLLNTGDGRALLSYKGLVSHSRWAWRLKDGIDRRFVARYQRLVSKGICDAGS